LPKSSIRETCLISVVVLSSVFVIVVTITHPFFQNFSFIYLEKYWNKGAFFFLALKNKKIKPEKNSG